VALAEAVAAPKDAGAGAVLRMSMTTFVAER
jgi:hypothetical protein